MEEVVYFELNNWDAGTDYPYAEPFGTWCGNDLHLYFSDEKFVKENKLCVVLQYIDMSENWCITAPKSFVLNNCPKLLSDEVYKVPYSSKINGVTTTYEETFSYKRFLRFPDEDGVVTGRFGAKFLSWSEENIGITYRS